MNIVLKSVLGLAAGSLLIAGAGALYLKGYSLESEQRDVTAGLLKDLRRIDATWNADVLRSRKGETKDYDAVTAPQSAALAVLDRVGEQDLGRFDHRLTEAQRALREAVVSKSDLVDRFKRESAIMRNSLRYLPAATAELKGKLKEAGDAAPQKRAQLETLATAAEQILQDAMRLESATDSVDARRLDIAVGRLTVNRGEYPPAILESFNVFAKHAMQVAAQKEREMETLQAIARVPLAEYTDALGNEARRAYDRAEGEHGTWRIAFYLYSALLAALAAFLAFRVLRRAPAAPRFHAAVRA